jgi:hypothetical protein
VIGARKGRAGKHFLDSQPGLLRVGRQAVVHWLIAYPPGRHVRQPACNGSERLRTCAASAHRLTLAVYRNFRPFTTYFKRSLHRRCALHSTAPAETKVERNLR